MYNKEKIQRKVDLIFEELSTQAMQLIESNSNLASVSEQITRSISGELIVRSKTLITDIYAEMSKHTLSSAEFEDAEHKNMFFTSNLRADLLEKYRFEIKNVDAYKKGINYHEINKIYASLTVAAGTATIGGVLSYALTHTVSIPIVVIIAGAVSAFCASYFLAVPKTNKAAFKKAILMYLEEMKKDFLKWLDDVEIYYNKRINELIKSF